MKRCVLQGFALVLVAGLCALAVLPARWLIAVWPASGPLVPVEASGSIWSGNAFLAIGRPELRRAIPEPLRWELRLEGGPHWVATHPALGGELNLVPSWRGLRVSAQSLRLPASALTTLHATLNSLNPGGDLVLSWPENTLGAGTRAAGTPLLELRWNNATSSLSRVRPVGGFRIGLLQGDGKRIDLVLSTLAGPLVMQGQGAYGPDSGLRFDGTARVAPAAPPEIHIALNDFLNTLGPRQGDHHTLRFR